jgi:hypothetical protein
MTFRLTPQRIQLSENDVEEACVNLLRYRGYWPVRQHVGKVRTPDDRWITLGAPGLPDWLRRRFGSGRCAASRVETTVKATAKAQNAPKTPPWSPAPTATN